VIWLVQTTKFDMQKNISIIIHLFVSILNEAKEHVIAFNRT